MWEMWECGRSVQPGIWPYFPRRSRVKFGQYSPNGCEVTMLSNDWNESYCYRCISTFQLFKYPQKLDNILFITQLKNKCRIWSNKGTKMITNIALCGNNGSLELLCFHAFSKKMIAANKLQAETEY
jgi:hypothetical protein